MHRREDLWGPDGWSTFRSFIVNFFLKLFSYLAALVFDPDRFLDDRVQKYLLPNPFIFLPFNAGPRICLGQQVSSFSEFGVPILIRFGSLHTTKCLCSSSGYCRRSPALALLLTRTLMRYPPHPGPRGRPGGRSRGCGSRHTLFCMRM